MTNSDRRPPQIVDVPKQVNDIQEEMETDNCHAQRSDISNKHFSRVYNAVAEVVVAARSKCEGGLELLTSM